MAIHMAIHMAIYIQLAPTTCARIYPPNTRASNEACNEACALMCVHACCSFPRSHPIEVRAKVPLRASSRQASRSGILKSLRWKHAARPNCIGEQMICPASRQGEARGPSPMSCIGRGSPAACTCPPEGGRGGGWCRESYGFVRIT